MSIKQKHESHVCRGGGRRSLLQSRRGAGSHPEFNTSKTKRARRRRRSGERRTKASLSSFEGEGEFGSGLPFAQDDFLLLLLLLLTVLLQLHPLLVDLSLLLHNPQLLLRLSHTRTTALQQAHATRPPQPSARPTSLA